MKTMIFRALRADEVELRVSTCNANGFSLLLYKDARCDMNLLDETVGPMNWQRSHEVVDGKLCCTVSIWDDEKKQWISKQDVGTESFTEKEKGVFSDSFKRACFNLGCGRELYTAPFIWIDGHTEKNEKGKYVPEKYYDRDLRITELVTESGTITKLVIKDKNSIVAFSYANGVSESAKAEKKAEKPKIEKTKEWIEARKDLEKLAEVKKIPMSEVLKVARVDSIDDMTLERLRGGREWLANR